jgi:UDP-N-acetylmuramoylalanine--D-glutamate ligase
MDGYFAAKAALAVRSDRVFAGSSVKAYLDGRARGGRSPGRTGGVIPAFEATWVPTEGQPFDSQLAGTAFADYPQRENFILAAAWWRASGLDPAALYGAARTFRLGRHRLSLVSQADGVSYWNDSKATNFHAVEAALARFPRPVLLIAGGRAKGGDISGFVRRIAPRVKFAFLIGDTRAELARACAAERVAHAECETLADAVRRAGAAATPGDHVLLSPAFASFDMFLNYEDRGDQFERLVREQVLAATAAWR